MATAGPSHPSPIPEAVDRGRMPGSPVTGRGTVTSARAGQHTAWRRSRSHGGVALSTDRYHRRARVRDSERSLTGRHLLRGRRAGLAITGVGGALCLLATACSGSSSTQHGSPNGGTKTVANSGAAVSITPANGSRNVKTSHRVSVTVTHGKIEDVSVTAGHVHAAGTLQGQTAWHTVWPLHTATRYTVTVTARGTDGKTTTTTSTFKTQRPAGTFTASTILGHQTY